MRRTRAGNEEAAAWSCDDEEGSTILQGRVLLVNSSSASASNGNINQQQQSLGSLYEKIKVIKRGSQGVVYLAREIIPSSNDESGISSSRVAQEVAIKRMFSDIREEKLRGIAEGPLREIGILSQLSPHCPQMIQFRGVCTTKSREMCLVMEPCCGDVTGFINSAGAPPMSFIAHVLRGTLLAVQHLHRNGVVHRDLKPSNVLLRRDGSIALADFGSARFVFDQQQQNTDRSGGGVVSPPLTPGARRTTLSYRAPEVLLGDRNYGRPADIWGVGLIMAEMLRGNHLFTASSEMQTLSGIFGFIGTPTSETWPGFRELPLLQAFNFAVVPATLRSQVKSWRGVVENPTPDVAALVESTLDLLERMMAANPAARPAVDQCLAHPFFSNVANAGPEAWLRWRDEGDMPAAKKPPVSVSLGMSLGLGDDDDDDDE